MNSTIQELSCQERRPIQNNSEEKKIYCCCLWEANSYQNYEMGCIGTFFDRNPTHLAWEEKGLNSLHHWENQ